MAFSGEIEKLERRWQENPLGLTFAPLAEAYRKTGDLGRALELLEQGLAQHPNYVPAHIVRGRCHLDAQSDPGAELAFLRVTELDPENVIALKGLAELSERGGRLLEAFHRLEVLLDVDRNNEEARGQLDRVRELMATQAVVAEMVQPEPVVAENKSPPPEAVPAGDDAELEYREPVYESAPPVYDAPRTTDPEPAAPFDEDSLGDIELEVSSQLTAATAHEFQIPNDSEMLHPTGQRIADIVLGAESQGDDADAGDAAESVSPDPLADSGGDSVEVLLGDEYASPAAYRDESAPPPGDPADAILGDTVFDQLAMVPEVPLPDADVLPPPLPQSSEPAPFLPPPPEPELEPVPAMEAEPVAAAASAETAASAVAEVAGVEPEQPQMADGYVALGDLGAPTPYQPAAPVQAEEPESSAAEEPELVVTETMAEIFLRQGHRELALAVYVQLAQRDPDNRRIAAALTRLAPESAAPPGPTPEPVGPFAASETGGRSVGQLFRALLSASRPTPASAIHPPAFELPKRVTGQPTRPAQESLSLSAVFGEESAPSGPAGAPQEGSPGEPSFDEFFAPATGSAADAELPRALDAAARPAQAPEDLEQFNAWLRGLKR